MNRRSDCRVCLPRVDLPARAETGAADSDTVAWSQRAVARMESRLPTFDPRQSVAGVALCLLVVAGLARFGSKRPGRATRHALMQYDRNSLRMVSEDLVRQGGVAMPKYEVLARIRDLYSVM